MLGNKIVSGLVSIALFLFSSYKGNDATFSDIFIDYHKGRLSINTTLDNAFKNDFDDIFKSGKKIKVWFSIKIENYGKTIFEDKCYHQIEYDPLSQRFEIYLSEDNDYTYVKSNEEIIEEISEFEYTCDLNEVDFRDNLDIEITAFLKKVNFAKMNKEIDLMLLWNFKKPKIKKQFNINKNVY